MQATCCAALVDELIAHGVRQAVVAPGSRSTPVALALLDRAELTVHVVHDERVAAFVALGAGLDGVPAVLLCTSGTAAANFHPAVVEAGLAAVPMIVITADRPPELRDVGAPQAIDQTHLYGRSVRWFHDPGVPDAAAAPAWRSLGARAVVAAATGPVHLNLPLREPLVGTPGALPPRRRTAPATAGTTVADADGALVDLLRRPRGLVLAGAAGARRADLARFVAATGWPLLADPVSGCRDVLGAIAVADALLRHPGFASERPDVIVRVGRPAASKVLAQWVAASGAPVLQVGGPGVIDPDHLIAGQVDATSIVGLAAPLAGVGDPAWAARWSAAAARAEDAIDRALGPEALLCEPMVARLVARHRPTEGRLVVAASMPMRDLEWFGGVAAVAHANRGANGIDGVVSTALGAALASGAPTLVLVGDIAFVHDGGALTGLAARDADLRIVVVDNDGGGIFSFLPQATEVPPDRFERLFGTPHGTDIVALAAAHGIDAATVTTAAELAARLLDAGPVGDPGGHRSGGERAGPRGPQRRRRRRARLIYGRISADSIAWNLACVSASSASGSLSATMPPPANRRARAAVVGQLGAAQRHRPRAVAGGVDPADGTGVAAAVDALDARRSAPIASARGWPPTAGVGDSARTSSSTLGGGDDSTPSMRVPRCCTLATVTIDGSGSQSRKLHHGSSVSWTTSIDDPVLDLVLGARRRGRRRSRRRGRRRRCAAPCRPADAPARRGRRPRRAAPARRRSGRRRRSGSSIRTTP